MIHQLVLGSLLTVLCVGVSALGTWGAELLLDHNRRWLHAPPHAPKLLLVVAAISLVVLVVLTVSVWIWAVALLMLGVFITMEEALYFALVAYTTVGFGDLVPPEEWRILGAMAAANGFISFGFLTALVIEGVAHVRAGYREHVLGDED